MPALPLPESASAARRRDARHPIIWMPSEDGEVYGGDRTRYSQIKCLMLYHMSYISLDLNQVPFAEAFVVQRMTGIRNDRVARTARDLPNPASYGCTKFTR